MKNETEMANFALTALKAGTINSIEDRGKSGVLCSTWIGHAIHKVLNDNTFFDLIVRETLSSVGDPIDGWGYRYSLPNDLAKVVGYFDSTGAEIADFYREGGQAVFCNVSPLYLRYVRIPTSIGDLPLNVAEACGYTLALIIGPGLEIEDTDLADVERKLIKALGASKRIDRRDRQPRRASTLWGRPRTY